MPEKNPEQDVPTTSREAVSWEALNENPPDTIATSRQQVHQAVQLLAAFAQATLEPRDDDGHRSMIWEDGTRSFRTEATPDGWSLALSLPHFTLDLRHGRDVVARFEHSGRSSEDARRWLQGTVDSALPAEAPPLEWPEYEIPEPPGGTGGPLAPAETHLLELSRWYHDADLLLQEIARDRAEASEVRCWPHHFDHATLLTFPPRHAEEETRYVGIGLSPGDAPGEAPYLYVNGWPQPSAENLPEVGGPGRWVTASWVGRVLDAEEVVEAGDTPTQERKAREFVERSVAAMRGLLGL